MFIFLSANQDYSDQNRGRFRNVTKHSKYFNFTIKLYTPPSLVSLRIRHFRHMKRLRRITESDTKYSNRNEINGPLIRSDRRRCRPPGLCNWRLSLALQKNKNLKNSIIRTQQSISKTNVYSI